MTKKLIPTSLAALALMASCSTGVKDSYQTFAYTEYNLIVDNDDPNQPAQASIGNYEVKYNISRNVMDIKASDIIINNQKYSFETDTMAIHISYFTTLDGKNVDKMSLYKKGNAGGAASDLTANFVYKYLPQTYDLTNPSFQISYSQRLDINYVLNNRYHVQSFWPSCYYTGASIAREGDNSYSTRNTNYIVQIDFEKNLAAAYVYDAEYSVDKPEDYPKVIKMADIPVKFAHDRFYLEAASPKTTVLGKKDGKTDMIESEQFQATDFSMELTSADLTEVSISYNIDGKSVFFRGCCILKGGM